MEQYARDIIYRQEDDLGEVAVLFRAHRLPPLRTRTYPSFIALTRTAIPIILEYGAVGDYGFATLLRSEYARSIAESRADFCRSIQGVMSAFGVETYNIVCILLTYVPDDPDFDVLYEILRWVASDSLHGHDYRFFVDESFVMSQWEDYYFETHRDLGGGLPQLIGETKLFIHQLIDLCIHLQFP